MAPIPSQPSLKRVPKAAPKAGKKKGRAPVVVTHEMLRKVPLFSGLSDDKLLALTTRCQHLEYARGEHAYEGPPIDGDGTPLFLILFGDLSVHRRQRDADEVTVNYLTVDDCFVERLIVDEDTRALRLTAMCPVRLLRMRYADVNFLIREDPEFRTIFSEVVRQVVERQKTRFDSTFQQDIARFFVQERLTFAGRIKLKRMDLCIECDGCYSACKDRHGTDRLGPSEVKYGLTEVPQNCHNCVVPECMDKCKFGHIERHPVTGEIVIDDNCIGCTMCSKGCSFGSIRMHPIEDLDLDRYFPNRAADAKGKAIAQKCDNCTDYADKACISACPTGALFQLDGAELFNNWQQFDIHNQSTQGMVASPITVPYLWRQFWLTMTVLTTLILTCECFGRLYWPTVTFTEFFFQLGWISEGIDPLSPFRAGDFFSHSLGYLGGSLMLGTQVYRFRGHFSSTPVLMEAHIWMGVIGAICAFFHTAFVFSDPIAVATFTTMMLAVLTGGIGRYVVHLVPRNKVGSELLLEEIDVRIGQLNTAIESAFSDRRTGHTAIVRLRDLVAQEKTSSRVSTEVGVGWGRFFGQLVALVRQDASTKRKVVALAGEMSTGLSAEQQQEIQGLMTEKSRLERTIGQQALFSKVLKRYRIVHVTASNVMFGALILHIVFALMYQVS